MDPLQHRRRGSGWWPSWTRRLGEPSRPDLPGWGRSDPLPDHHAPIDFEAEAVEALIQQTGSAPVHLVGHSSGGTLALAIALGGRLPVQTLTLFEPLPIAILADTGDEDAFSEIATFVNSYRRSFETGAKWAAGSVIDLWGGAGTFDAMSPAVREFIASTTAQNLRTWQGTFAFRPSLDALATLQVSTTLVHGALSHRIAKLIAERLKQYLPRSSLLEFPNASHFMIHSHAAESARLIGQTATGI